MQQLKAEIIYNKKIKDVFWHCAFRSPAIAREAVPGQFVNIRLSDGCQPLLRRPFSVHRIEGSSFEVMYQVLGEGTEIFSRQKEGAKLDIIGPLGNGFTLLPSGKKALLVAGGMGVAPLVFLARRLRGRGITALIGARSKSEILCEKDFIEAGCGVKIATDDGSRGFRGYVSGLLEKELTGFLPGRKIIYACGPKPMLQETGRIAARFGVKAQLSLEEHMACGIGACLGCVVNTSSGFRRVCKDGPVFEASELSW